MENWDDLSREAFWFAGQLIAYRWWRGREQGVMPDGNDAESVVNDAVAELYNGKCRLKPDYNPQELRYELRRLVYNQVHRFHRRKETHMVRNDIDVTPMALLVQGRSILEWIPGKEESPAEQTIRKEARKRFRKFMMEFSAFLGDELDLRNLFECICAAFEKREEIAARLGVAVQTVTNARKRLDRRLDEFGEGHPEYPRVFIEEMKRV
jgi:DNA-directed RNA polymerase specialized sigma24 family protein